MAQLPKGDHAGAVNAAFQIIFAIIGTMAVALRIVAAYLRGRNYQAHDHLCFLCYICLIGYSTVICVGTFYGGYGQHIMELEETDPNKVVISLKTYFAADFFYIFGAAAVRLSILALYITVFQTRVFRIIAYVAAGIVTAFWAACIIWICALCEPVALNWNRTLKGHCGSLEKSQLASAAGNAGLDLMLILIPLPVVWRLQMPTKKKATLSAVFSLGLVNCGINAARIAEPLITDLNDFTYALYSAAILVGAEILTGLLVSSIPTYGPILSPRKFLSRYSPQGPSIFTRKRRTPHTDESDTLALYSNGTGIGPIDSSFQKLDEENAPQDGAFELKSMNNKDRSKEKPVESRGSLESNVIGVRRDVEVFRSARRSHADGDPSPNSHLGL